MRRLNPKVCSDGQRYLLTYSLTYLFTYLLHSAESFLRSSQFCSQSRNPPHFMEPEDSLRHSKVTATCLYPEPALFSPYSYNPFPEDIHHNIIILSTPGSSKWSLALRFPLQNPVYTSPLPIRATLPANLILLYLSTRTVSAEQYRSLSLSWRQVFSCLNDLVLACARQLFPFPQLATTLNGLGLTGQLQTAV